MSMDTREDRNNNISELVDERPMCSNCGTMMRKSSTPDTWKCPNACCSASMRPEFIKTRIAAEFQLHGKIWVEADDDSGLMYEGQVVARPFMGQLLDSMGNSKVMGVQSGGVINILESLAQKSLVLEKDSNGQVQIYKVIKATRKSAYDNGQKGTPFENPDRPSDNE